MGRRLHDGLPEFFDSDLKPFTLTIEFIGLDSNPLVLQTGQHFHQWDLGSVVEGRERFRFEFPSESPLKTKRDVRVLAGVWRGLRQWNLAKRPLGLSPSNQRFDRHTTAIEDGLAQGIEFVGRSGGILDV